MADDNVKPSGFRPFFGVILTMEKRWTDMKTGGWKFFPSLQILSSWWIISFERPDLPRGLDPCYRAEEPSREEEETEKKEVVKMDLPIIVIDVIFWSGALCKNVGMIWGTGTLHCICQFWHDQENIKLHTSMTSSSLFWNYQ